jgi:arginase
VIAYPVTEMESPVASAVEARALLSSRTAQLLVHLDVDVIDYAEFPLADCPRYHAGIRFDTTMECLSTFLASPQLAAVVVSEVNPDHDISGSLTARLVNGLTDAFQRAKAAEALR